MWNRQDIKARGKAAFKANYWKSVGVSFLLSLLAGGVTASARSNIPSEDSAEQSLEEASGLMPEITPAIILIFVSAMLK